MPRNAALRVYDTNIPSGLSRIVCDLKDRGVKIEDDMDYISPHNDPTMPKIVIINPLSNPPEEYFSRIRQCAQNNPESKFILFMPSFSSYDSFHKAKQVIGKLYNLEYFGSEDVGSENNLNPMKRIKDITDNLISKQKK